MDIVDPIFLVGAPRSGTTILAQMLAEHRHVHLVSEARLTWHIGAERSSDVLRPESLSPERTERIRDAFSGMVPPGRRMLEKNPSSSVRLPFVDYIFPDARYIHIVRDGWSCVPAIARWWERDAAGILGKRDRERIARRLAEASLLSIVANAPEAAARLNPWRRWRVWGPRVPGLKEIAQSQGVFVAAAYQWAVCVSSILESQRTIGTDRVCTVRFEEMGGHSLETIEDFCGLERDISVVGAMDTHFDPTKVVARSPGCTAAEIREAAAFIRPVNRLLGYE